MRLNPNLKKLIKPFSLSYKKVLVILLVLILLYVGYYLWRGSNMEHYNETVLIEDSIYGKFKCYKSDRVICEMIQHSKAWEKHLLDKMLEHYKPDTNMLDIGANYGCHSVGVGNEIKKNGGRGKIYSFELQPNILTLLKENISMNGLSEIIQVYEHGLGDKNETKVFALPSDYDDNTNPGALSLHNEHSNLDKGKTVQDTQVNIRRLDDLAIHNISFIKIDVEGYELEVFEGGKETISREKPVIMIEIWGRVKDKYYAWIQNNFPFYEIQHISGEDYLLVPRA